jgi:predicted  nucleic acid-binding Zn-ribbon protein
MIDIPYFQIDYKFKSQYNYKMDKLFQRLDSAERAIATVKNKVARRDLLKMVKVVDQAIVAADMESVECRRLHKETRRYKELIQKVDGLLTNLEQHITLANLLG